MAGALSQRGDAELAGRCRGDGESGEAFRVTLLSSIRLPPSSSGHRLPMVDPSTGLPGRGVPVPVPEPPGPDLIPEPTPNPQPPDVQPWADPQIEPEPRPPELPPEDPKPPRGG